ncbi:hypothetical protein LB450_13520 [Psychroflexus sp. CAK1W]|uniref:hypothetical protein n=1 Tax=Psychroflexus curvus TaxID=2873595 RepID=UPI001CCB4979|nr:hypothetical protein [Psychroflexus curvus]MBZ9629122.1 hypothetical protein [Psychroflexus curvus]
MRYKAFLCIAILPVFLAFNSNTPAERFLQAGRFAIEKDLLLVQFDCKTDVDDLQTVAAFKTLMSNPAYSKLNYHAVAGTYGMQEGLYVPPNALFQLAFGENWTDAHTNWKGAVETVKSLAIKTLMQGGDVWIADAGQSDFSAELVDALQKDLPEIETSKRIHVVQHAEWNEEVTTPEKLDFVKRTTDYVKIPDGNGVGNGTPGFRDPDFTHWEDYITDPALTEIWQLAVDLANKYNGKEGRYTNEAILAGGLDFSDLAEVCWILGLEDLRDTEHFFKDYAN